MPFNWPIPPAFQPFAPPLPVLIVGAAFASASVFRSRGVACVKPVRVHDQRRDAQFQQVFINRIGAAALAAHPAPPARPAHHATVHRFRTESGSVLKKCNETKLNGTSQCTYLTRGPARHPWAHLTLEPCRLASSPFRVHFFSATCSLITTTVGFFRYFCAIA